MLGAFFKSLLSRNDPIKGEDEFRGDYYDPDQLVRFATKKAEKLKARGLLDYPAIVHLETLAVCNAACSFCPYPTLERKGVRMPDELIAKIIGDLSDIPKNVGFQLAPYKVSEPFLEPRLFDVLELVNSKLPNANISIITNGSPLTERKIGQLGKVRNLSYINVSMNHDNPEEYESVMKIPFARTVERLDMLHRKHAEGVITCRVRLTRVATNRDDDVSFIHWVRANFPRFKPDILPRHDWIGEVTTPDGVRSVPDAPCHRWFDMSITATGVVAMCCMDGSAKYPKGDVNTQHVLEIYNQPWLRELRATLVSRRQTRSPCNRCTYLSY
ncbi:MAG: radical SAM protein [Betaproteobacteria bacterium]|nr:radical SAM protein [Betaproteobacteria bacterium]